MKKLLLLISTLLVSVTGWAWTEDNNWDKPNPFAYNLTSSIDLNANTLTLNYELNADAYTSQQIIDASTEKKNPIGLQIYLLDENGKRLKKANGSEWAITSGGYTKGSHSVIVSLSDIPAAYQGQKLSWEVVVHGNPFRTVPKKVKTASKVPTNAYGIAINNCSEHPDFAKIYVSEASPSSTDSHNSLLQFDPYLDYKVRIKKDYHNEQSGGYFSGIAHGEPHRVKVSEDGRLFVSSFLPGAGTVVYEYKGGNKFYNVIDNLPEKNKNLNGNTDDKDALWRRVVGMDVKGQGENLTILLCWIDANYTKVVKGSTTFYNAKVECWEYKLGLAEKNDDLPKIDLGNGVKITRLNVNGVDESKYVTKVAEFNDFWTNKTNGQNSLGLLYQAFNGNWDSGLRGFVDVAYGKGNDIWMKFDYGSTDANASGQIMLFRDRNNVTTYSLTTLPMPNSYWTGASGMYINGSTLITAAGENQIFGYTINDNGSLTKKWTLNNTHGIDGVWITSFTADNAGNIYALLEKELTLGGKYTANVIQIAMPYNGTTITRAKESFSVTAPTPVANILPTKMRYVPAPTNGYYNFSFYANTKPKYAEIRFYGTQEDMKASMAAVNDDNFQGDIESSKTGKLLCAYRIPNPKQGLNTVQFAMLGGEIGQDKYLTSAALPDGELYWSVYLETERSTAFAPIYRQANSGVDAHHTLHATINNYPETDQFGTIYATSENGTDMKLMQYEIRGENGATENSLNNTTRYSLTAIYPYANLQNTHPRRMDVDEDGMLYIAHEGYIEGYTDGKKYDNVPTFKEGGIYLWDPNTAVNGESIDLTLFSNNGIGTSSAVVLNNHPTDRWRVFATNTYNEYKLHLQNETTGYTEEQQNDIYGWNGFVEYVKAKYATNNGSWNWTEYSNPSQDWSAKKWALKQGDASGNISLVAMDKGLWICQHREHSVAVKVALRQSPADNPTAYVLRFWPYGYSEGRMSTWRSCTTSGLNTETYKTGYDNNGTPQWYTDSKRSANSQKSDAPIQATPGAGLAYRKINGEDYLFINNQDGNIVREKLAWSNNTSPSFYLTGDYHTIITTPDAVKGVLTASVGSYTGNWKTAAVSSMCFDYAGNLITTTGVSYETKDVLKTGDQFGTPKDAQNIIVYTMRYNRTNAREIQAPNSCVRIAERLAYTENAEDMREKVTANKECYIDLFRPMSNSSFSTICLPFTYDLSQLKEGEPYYNAIVRPFAGVQLSTIGEEKVLVLQFGDPVKVIEANVPYIIQPENNITGIVQIKQLVTLTNTNGGNTPINFNDGEKENSITFNGVIPMTEIPGGEGTNNLILVADNRLAKLSASGPMYGFRAYFELANALPKGMKTKIGNKDNTVTGLIEVDGKKVNVEKFLREGRVYIRVGETLYNVNGQKVE